MSNQEYDIQKDADEKGKIATKVLDALVFDRLGIDYEFKIERNKYGVKPFYFTFWIDVHVDKMFVDSPTYDYNYDNSIYEIEDKVEKALRYVSLQDYFGGIIFNYVDDDLVEDELRKLDNKLFDNLVKKYPNITKDQFKDSNIYFYLYKPEESYPSLTVEFIGLDIRDDNDNVLVTCEQLADVMLEMYKQSPLVNSFYYENQLCI